MQKVKKDILGTLVYENMIKMLLNKDLVPGQKVNKKDIVEIIGVSQTPVNEAFSRLLNEGLLVQNGRSDFYIREFTDQDMIELFEVRAGLEGSAARIFAERVSDGEVAELEKLFSDFDFPLDEDKDISRYEKADQKFHSRILKCCQNRLLGKMVHNYELFLKYYRRGLLRPPEVTYPEHLAIIKAFHDHDSAKAQKAMMDHHFATRNYLLHKLEE